MNEEYPFVTAMIVVRNEEKYIGKAILSFLNQDYPKERMELLVIDSDSTDNTLKIAKNAIRHAKNACKVYFYNNPQKVLAAGWNIGIKNAKGEYVIRIDAHAEAHPSLISTCINIFKKNHDVDVVGCALQTISTTVNGKVVANVQSSPFGVGNSKSRYTFVSGYVDSVPYGLYRKNIFDKVGLFNEKFVRNQDNDMHGRIHSIGGKFYLCANIKSIYYSRTSIKGMMKQAVGNGKWIMIGLKESESKKGVSIRHLVPFIFFLTSLLLLIGAMFNDICRILILCIYVLYIACALFYSFKKTKKIKEIIKTCCCFWLYHMSYGLGTFIGMFRVS